ncbi:integrase catalytic domain-containing protein [Amaricoccus solimangrovi]|nr:DDE-type integrase/transposase/recombinase [Amaricoccus solimangrovi]
MATRAELLAAVGDRYRRGDRDERGRILDEFTALTGYHRKHAIRLLAREPVPKAKRRGRRASYGAEVRAALLVLWNLSDRVCSKRLREMIPLLLPAAIRHGVIDDASDLSTQLLKVSPATIDRLLAEARISAQAGRRRRAGMSSAIRREVPVRTFNDWGDPAPGFVEADFVAHGGTDVAGSFVQTLVLTDIATGWTECVPVVTRSAPLVVKELEAAMALFPFPLGGIDFDNDGSFMNDQVVPWCRAHGLTVTRSRAYKKNDQAWVEQKNGAIVRRLIGYGRLEGLDTAHSLGRLYAAARLHVNLYQPSFKLRSKVRIGAKVRKTWDRPTTPAARLLAREDLSPATRERVLELRAASDPVELMRLIRQAQDELGQRVDRRGLKGAREAEAAPVTEQDRTTVASIARSESPPRLHRRAYRRTKPIQRRPSRLDPYVAEVRVWLTVDPTLTAAAIQERLTHRNGGHLVGPRSVQKLVRLLRVELLEQEIALIARSLNSAA